MNILAPYLITYFSIGASWCLILFLFELKLIYNDLQFARYTNHHRALTLLFYRDDIEDNKDVMIWSLITFIILFCFLIIWPCVVLQGMRNCRELSKDKKRFVIVRFLRLTCSIGLLHGQYKSRINLLLHDRWI